MEPEEEPLVARFRFQLRYFRSRFEEQAAGMAALRLALIAARQTGCSEDIQAAQADWDAALHRLFLLQHVVAGIEQEIVVLGLA